MSILYLETNFLVGLAKGQDAGARKLVSAPPPFRIAIPSLCFMEAFSRFEADQKQWRRNEDQLNFIHREAQRDRESPDAASLAEHLEESLEAGGRLQAGIGNRLRNAMLWLADHGEPIPLEPGLIRTAFAEKLVEDPTDNLILHTIMHHARANPSGPRAFASENVQDFGSFDIGRRLDPLGIRYFRRIEAAVGWLGSQIAGESDRS